MSKTKLNRLKKDLKNELNKIHEKNLYGCELFSELFLMCEKSKKSVDYLDLTLLECDELYITLEKELQRLFVICNRQVKQAVKNDNE